MAASVSLEYYAWLPRVLGLAERDGRVFVEEPIGAGETVGSLLRRLAAGSEAFRTHVYALDDDRVREYVALLVNGRAVDLVGGLSAQLRNGDDLVFLPGFSGGRG